MKYVIAFTIIIVVGLAGWWGYSTYLKPKPSPSSALTQTSALSPAVEALLTQKLALLTDLVANASLVKAVETAGSTNAKLTQSQIQELDAKWQKSAATDPFITQFLTNSMAQTLFTFQEQNPGFAELLKAGGPELITPAAAEAIMGKSNTTRAPSLNPSPSMSPSFPPISKSSESSRPSWISPPSIRSCSYEKNAVHPK